MLMPEMDGGLTVEADVVGDEQTAKIGAAIMPLRKWYIRFRHGDKSEKAIEWAELPQEDRSEDMDPVRLIDPAQHPVCAG
jgi:hypothetical protein